MQKKFSLVLGGGSVRGLAHIGVIERLEELGVAPVEISGTSVGAIIGAFYAAGYTSKEMKEIVHSINFLTLIDLDLKNGLIKGNKLMKFFTKYLRDITFSSLKIPLSIVATDIDTGEKIVFREGKVIDAIRASIGIPGIFTPYKYQGRHLIDGGIMDNLPIGVLDNQEVVVAVSAQMEVNKKIRVKKSFFFPNGTMFSNSYEIIRKTINIMMIQNEKKSLELCPTSLLIRPGRDDIEYYDLKKMNVMIIEGYRSSELLIPFFNS